ncbi:type II toxin-antitoxin system death-on-curing family toxin [Candidatus Halobeggiatoa sp. HSG11]|nr:type II toxin-antitoxin system death-on-curing family toxin [Candidatus Halobeggiatoa sp. HSG11]
MNDPEFLTLNEILETHRISIELYGGSYGIHDQKSLESAINMPCSTFDGKYLHSDLYEMAAAYLFHLVKNHPFIDGNKRIGTRAALLFLYLNSIEVKIDPDELADFVISVVENNVSKKEIADYFRQYVQIGI